MLRAMKESASQETLNIDNLSNKGLKLSRQKRKRTNQMNSRQLMFVPLDSASQSLVQEESLVATSTKEEKPCSFSNSESEDLNSSTLSLADSSTHTHSSDFEPCLESRISKSRQKTKLYFEKGLLQERNSPTIENVQPKSSVEDIQDSQTSQESHDRLRSRTDSKLQRANTSVIMEASLETAVAQLESSVRRMEGIANMSFLQLVSTTLDMLFTYLWKMACPCFCFHLQGNCISFLPDSIKLFSESITHLYLQDNRLQAFPLTLCCLRKLKVLDLSRNRLQTLPEEISNLQSLIILDVSDNNLIQLPSSLKQMPRLKTIHYGGNPKLQR
ncbi:hypothetical protein GpartN1_g3237.t1 [Galdieria partita]|uniref:Uncharacterized protein n=1 Tax=Galdieria partita TaxID=83374 RepID=A0A9C7PX63_9RHOD|nr:hypothetical protein GpartN1_g3237.t1 [Galdieria partita]